MFGSVSDNAAERRSERRCPATATQPTQDGPSKKDWRGGRNAYQNIIPDSTGAAIELNDRFFKIVSWYDNEAGYSNRCIDKLKMLAAKDGTN